MSTTTSYLLKFVSLHHMHKQHNSSPQPQPRMSTTCTRRDILFTSTLAATLLSQHNPSKAEDIGLFGIRKRLKKAEEEAEVIVKQGIEDAEKEVESVEREVETAVSFGGLAQAAVVVGAEVVGVLVATSVVNGILGPEGQES